MLLRGNSDGCGLSLLANDVLHAVLNEGLQSQGWDFHGTDTLGNSDLVLQAPTEARRFNFKVVANHFQFLIEGNEAGLVGADGETKQRGQFADSVLGAFGVG